MRCENCSVRESTDTDVLLVIAQRETDPSCLRCIDRRRISLMRQKAKRRRSGSQKDMSSKDAQRRRGRRISRRRGANN